MTRRYLAIASVLTTCVLLAAAVAAQQPRIINGRLSAQPAGTLAETVGALVAAQSDVAWIGYAVPARDRNRTTCCWSSADGRSHFTGSMSGGNVPCCGGCRIEPAAAGSADASPAPAGTAAQGPIKLEGAERMVVLFRVVDRQIERIRSFSEDCELDAGGRQVHWLQDVRPAESVMLLTSLLEKEPARKSRVSNAALLALSQHAEPSAVAAIEAVARTHAAAGVRGEALFWLAQMAGAKVAATITAAIENDPNTEVKRRAVFALSQLPKNEGVPLLIDQARRNTNPVVRKQAMFWLGQSKDPRAIEFFAEILK